MNVLSSTPFQLAICPKFTSPSAVLLALTADVRPVPVTSKLNSPASSVFPSSFLLPARLRLPAAFVYLFWKESFGRLIAPVAASIVTSLLVPSSSA